MKHPLAVALAFAMAAAVPAYAQDAAKPESAVPMSANPFSADSPLAFQYPQFDKIKDSDFAPAFDAGMSQQLAEMEAIANDPAKPTFANTIVPMEKSGAILSRALSVFFNLVGADTNPARDKIQSDYSAKFAAHRDAINLNPKLFARVKALYDARAGAGYDAEDLRLVEKYYDDFVRSGALLSAADQAKLKQINAELAELGTKFSQNVLAEVNASALVVDDVKELDGLSEQQIATAASVAKSRGLEGKYVLTLLNTTGQPPESQLTNRALRQRLHEASIVRGSRGGDYDNREIISKIMTIRANRAKLLGYANHAAYGLEDQTARTPEAVNTMLGQLAPPAGIPTARTARHRHSSMRHRAWNHARTCRR